MTGSVRTHSRARVVALLLLTFSAGAAVGLAGSRMITTGETAETTRRDGPRFAIERYADELGLTDAQREQIAPILERTRGELESIVSDVRPSFRQVYESARTEIETVLTPEQTERYREILESRRRGAGERDRGPHGAGGHEGGERE